MMGDLNHGNMWRRISEGETFFAWKMLSLALNECGELFCKLRSLSGKIVFIKNVDVEAS